MDNFFSREDTIVRQNTHSLYGFDASNGAGKCPRRELSSLDKKLSNHHWVIVDKMSFDASNGAGKSPRRELSSLDKKNHSLSSHLFLSLREFLSHFWPFPGWRIPLFRSPSSSAWVPASPRRFQPLLYLIQNKWQPLKCFFLLEERGGNSWSARKRLRRKKEESWGKTSPQEKVVLGHLVVKTIAYSF